MITANIDIQLDKTSGIYGLITNKQPAHIDVTALNALLKEEPLAFILANEFLPLHILVESYSNVFLAISFIALPKADIKYAITRNVKLFIKIIIII